MPLLILLALGAFSSSLSVRILDPLVPELARDLAATAGTVALVASAVAFPFALAQPILGPLGDAYGKARTIKVCLAVLTLSLAAAALAPTIEVLFAARVVSGIASGGIVPLCFAMIGDRFAMQERQVALSRVLTATILGQLLGAMGAGWIASVSSWRVVMAICCAVTAVAVVASWRGLAPLPGAQRKLFSPATIAASYRIIVANPRAFVCFGAVLVEGIAIFGLLPFLAVILEADSAGSIREAGFIIAGMAAGGILYTLSVKSMLRRLDFMALIRIGGVVCAAGLAVLATLHAWPPKMLAFVAVGFGFYMIHNSIQTQVTELAPEARGASVSLHAFSFFLGQAIGPLAYRLGLATLGAQASITLAAAVMLVLGFATAAGFARR